MTLDVVVICPPFYKRAKYVILPPSFSPPAVFDVVSSRLHDQTFRNIRAAKRTDRPFSPCKNVDSRTQILKCQMFGRVRLPMCSAFASHQLWKKQADKKALFSRWLYICSNLYMDRILAAECLNDKKSKFAKLKPFSPIYTHLVVHI